MTQRCPARGLAIREPYAPRLSSKGYMQVQVVRRVKVLGPCPFRVVYSEYMKQGLIFPTKVRYSRFAKHCFVVVSIANANRLTFIIMGFGTR
jgi:hypothetical protein